MFFKKFKNLVSPSPLTPVKISRNKKPAIGSPVILSFGDNFLFFGDKNLSFGDILLFFGDILLSFGDIIIHKGDIFRNHHFRNRCFGKPQRFKSKY